jgi:Tfp pilus assembly protein PilV
MTKLKNSLGFSAVEALLILIIVGILGFTGWFVYHSQRAANKNYDSQPSTTQASTTKNSDAPSATNAKTKAMATWSEFSNTTVGLKFKYPSQWGQAKFEVMHPNPDELNPTFYKVSFDKRTYTYVTIKPKASVKDYDTTFANLKADNAKYASTRHIFTNQQAVVGAIVPDSGNQQAAIYAARSISLTKVDASDIVLFDAKSYDASCTQASYASSCYTPEELNNYQWFLEGASAL